MRQHALGYGTSGLDRPRICSLMHKLGNGIEVIGRRERVRLENGLLAEHWDVIEDEATREKSASGLPMFGNSCPT
jgi:hypothetical protein